MPRLKSTPDDYFRSSVDGKLSLYGRDINDLAKAARVTPQTIRNHHKQPDKVNLGELRRMASYLCWTAEDICRICGVSYKG